VARLTTPGARPLFFQEKGSAHGETRSPVNLGQLNCWDHPSALTVSRFVGGGKLAGATRSAAPVCQNGLSGRG
jgi:hypothetical protein